ncbi:MAG: methylmalonyl Co-A mutase-associated GTPase MeaB [Acidimicrobiales bacterium]
MAPPLTLEQYRDGVLGGDRTVLARAVTLVESARPDHQRLAQELLVTLLPHAGKSHRVGVTGVPGVGKSTFIERFGTTLTGAGHRVAVLAVDPTSSRTGGSILGDKTRMPQLAVDPEAFVRPSPSRGTLGGVTRATRETMVIVEAAGFDVVLVETVGVGQSETIVADMVDFFLVLMLAGAGDELQGIKKGILELADLLAINKADGDNIRQANAAVADYATALHLVTPPEAPWQPPVVTCSGQTGDGLDVIWSHIERHRAVLQQAGLWQAHRQSQQLRWMWAMAEERVLDRLHRGHPDLVATLEQSVLAGQLTAALAAERLLAAFNTALPPRDHSPSPASPALPSRSDS